MLEFELDFLRLLQEGRNPIFNFLFKLFTYLGQSEALFILIALFYFILNKNYGRKLVFISCIAGGFNNVVKNLVKRPRPFAPERGDKKITCVYEDTATGYSFPSGHSETVSSYTVSTTLEFKKKWMIVVTIIACLLVGFSRLYLGAHFPSDVVVGLAIGALCAFLGGLLYDKAGYKKAFLYTIIFTGIFCIIFLFNAATIQADLYKTFGMIVGSFLGFLFEEKKVNFKLNNKIWKRILEAVIALVIAVALKAVLKLPYSHLDLSPALSNILDMVRYTITCFAAMGLAPYIYKVTGLNK